jgi:hypothetical protein
MSKFSKLSFLFAFSSSEYSSFESINLSASALIFLSFSIRYKTDSVPVFSSSSQTIASF